MRRGILWTLLLLGLPHAAAADGANAVPPVVPDVDAAIERAAPAPDSPPALDLRIDPAPLPSALPNGAPASQGDLAEFHDRQEAADRGFSFGLEIKPRTRLGALARRDEPGDPGLDEQLENLIERPVFGLRGRYRF
jgi:hypothetical protein